MTWHICSESVKDSRLVYLQATEQGIWVSNIPSSATGNALSCAEHAIYLMMATLRQQNSMRESIQQGRVGVPVGETLFGKSVLIVGFGNIAKELIPRQALPANIGSALPAVPYGMMQ